MSQQLTAEELATSVIRSIEKLEELGVIENCRVDYQRENGWIVEAQGMRLELHSFRELNTFLAGILVTAQFMQKHQTSSLMKMRISISDMTIGW